MSETNNEPVVAQVQTPEAKCATFLFSALPAFRKYQKELEERNKTEVFRVLAALIEAPLEETTHSFTTERGQSLFNLGLEITNCKLILFNSALKMEDVVAETNEKMKDINKESV